MVMNINLSIALTDGNSSLKHIYLMYIQRMQEVLEFWQFTDSYSTSGIVHQVVET